MDKRETEKVESGAFTFSSFSKTRKTSKRSVLINNVKKNKGEWRDATRSQEVLFGTFFFLIYL